MEEFINREDFEMRKGEGEEEDFEMEGEGEEEDFEMGEEEGEEEDFEMGEGGIEIADYLQKSMIGITPNGVNMIYSAPYGYVALVSNNEYKIIKLAWKYHIPTITKIYDLTVKDDTTGRIPIIRRGLDRVSIGPGNFFIDKLFTFFDWGEYNWTMVALPHGGGLQENAWNFYETNDQITGYSSQIIGIKFSKNANWINKINTNWISNGYVHIKDKPTNFFQWSPDMSSADLEDFQEKDVGNINSTLYGSFYLDWKDKNLEKYISVEGKSFIQVFETNITTKIKGLEQNTNFNAVEKSAFMWQRKLGVKHKDRNLCEYLTKIGGKSAAAYATEEGTVITGFQNSKLPDMLGRIVHMVFIFNNNDFWKWRTGPIARINYGFLIYQIYLTILGSYEMEFILKQKGNLSKYKFSLKQSIINTLLCENLCVLSSLPLYNIGRDFPRNGWNDRESTYCHLINLIRGNIPSGGFSTINQTALSFFKPTVERSVLQRNDILWTFISHGEMVVNLCDPIAGGNVQNTVSKAQEYAKASNGTGDPRGNAVTILGDTHHMFIANCTPWFLYFNESQGYTSQYTEKAINQLELSEWQNESSTGSREHNDYKKQILVKKSFFDSVVDKLLETHNGNSPKINFDERTPQLRMEDLAQLAEMDESDVEPTNANPRKRTLMQMRAKPKDVYYTKTDSFFRTTIETLQENHDQEENAKKKKKIRKKILKKLKMAGITDIEGWAKQNICTFDDLKKQKLKKQKLKKQKLKKQKLKKQKLKNQELKKNAGRGKRTKKKKKVKKKNTKKNEKKKMIASRKKKKIIAIKKKKIIAIRKKKKI